MGAIATIRRAIEATLLHIKETDGYSVTVTEDKIRPFYDLVSKQTTNIALYPKLYVVFDGGENGYLPSQTVEKTMNFLVVAVFKDKSDLDSAQISAEDFVDDCMRLFARYDTLNGLVDDIKVTGYSTDSGSISPESAAVIRVEVFKVSSL